jgi:hypothetical protein
MGTESMAIAFVQFAYGKK